MIHIRYFARYREMLDCEREDLDYSEQINTVEMMMSLLDERGDPWSAVFNQQQRILTAINQDMVDKHTVIEDGDEVAFFPPVTGG